MSYEIVRSIALKQNENGFWYAVVTSACNNVRPHYYSKWEYCKNNNLTKEELQKNILLDFYYGNFHGGKNTRYGKFLQFLGGSWGCRNENSRACKTYHFYEKIKDMLKLKHERKKKEFPSIDILYDKYYKELYYMICSRCNRELKNQLYKEFLEFKPSCKPTIVRLWRDNTHVGFALQRNKQRLGFYITDSYNYATKYTNNVKLNYVKKLAEKSNFKVELIEV